MSELLYHLTKIRLLAPAKTLRAAQNVRWAHKRPYDELQGSETQSPIRS
jgi:hypothetical protein